MTIRNRLFDTDGEQNTTRLDAEATSSGSRPSGAHTRDLASLLEDRETALTLNAVFEEPRADMNEEPTAVFPYTLVTDAGDVYAMDAKEFLIPDDGLNSESPLTAFLADLLVIPTDGVTTDVLGDVEGITLDVEHTDDGDFNIQLPSTNTDGGAE